MNTTTQTPEEIFAELGKAARQAASVLAISETAQKNEALMAIAAELEQQRAEILAANMRDLENAKASTLDAAVIDRLTLDDNGLSGMITSLQAVATLADPVGTITDLTPRPSGIQVGRMRVPLGVIGMIYESRPNVTCEAASLAIKSGNAILLRGGSEAHNSNQAIAASIQTGLKAAGLPTSAVQVMPSTDRALVGQMLTSPQWVDVVIPRGGKNLIARVSQEATVPVIKHLDGNCHLYIDESAEQEMAIALTVNAKTQRFGTCNTLESLLIHKNEAEVFFPILKKALAPHQIELRVCEQLKQHYPEMKAATDSDWAAEYLGPILSVKVVADMPQAIAHINQYGSHHTDGIVTQHHGRAMHFLRAVDSSSVIINASTRFADGFQFGLGAEIGISTDKFHARGPVGLMGLTSEKYVVLGQGQCRS